ncbi:multiple epidermal growth factor-like domains protein 6 isoform X2 [Artemia franciscana]|uniref:EGF-like domain-containing protein n=1 Tax=Artemia franciscana TaxID=6661 RepID=A0AA88HT45_ARTSF|nr:hypothetical protein QYM36_010337 [Artemia franciscana]
MWKVAEIGILTLYLVLAYGNRYDGLNIYLKCYSASPCLNGGRCLRKNESGCACPRGFTGSKCQHDINECSVSNGGCEHRCCNLHGTYTCRCEHGFKLKSNGRNCEDIDECSSFNGGCSQICINSPGSYTCSCRDGFKLHTDNRTCLVASSTINGGKIQFCRIRNGGCQQLCEVESTGGIKCACKQGYELRRDGRTCKSVNPCRISNGGCHHFCHHTAGISKKICSCKKGFSLLADGATCQDDDECFSNPCDHLCKNTPGGYSCLCRSGYKLAHDGRTCIGKTENFGRIPGTVVRSAAQRKNEENNEEENNSIELSPSYEEHEKTDLVSQIKVENLAKFESGDFLDEYREIEDPSLIMHTMETDISEFENRTEENLSEDEEVIYEAEQKVVSKSISKIVHNFCEDLIRKCDHYCTSTSNGSICSCRVGWKLLEDKTTCIVDEEDSWPLRGDNPIDFEESPRHKTYKEKKRVDKKLHTENVRSNSIVREELEDSPFDPRLSLSKKCIAGAFGKDCSLNCDDCRNGARCNANRDGCQCLSGYKGLTCDEKCSEGTYGHMCAKICNCPVGYRCQSSDGSCFLKTDNLLINKRNEDSADGYVNDGNENMQVTDLPCINSRSGTNCHNKCHCGPKGLCSSNGVCLCPLGKTGDKCLKICPEGTYGPNCIQKCKCQNSAVCDPKIGSCHCKPGFYGPTCEFHCPIGRYGHHCLQECNCSPFGTESCDITNGKCICKFGFAGKTCKNEV